MAVPRPRPSLDLHPGHPAGDPLVPAIGASSHWLEPQEKFFGLSPQLIHVNGELTGRFPVWLNRWRYIAPTGLITSWQTPLTFAGTPFVRKDLAEETLEAFLSQNGASAFLLNAVPASGPFWESLMSVCTRCAAPVEIMGQWQRAALSATGSFEEWFEGNFERKRKKEYRRLRARLSETGNLVSAKLQPGDPLDPWIDELLALEAQGWKGRQGSAVASEVTTADCLRACLHNLHAVSALRFWKLALDGKPVAMMFAMVEGSQAWLGKIAFDEDQARYSPGVLLVLDATADLIADPQVATVDSCAIPDHPMINNIWRDRLDFCDVLIGRPGMSRTIFGLYSKAERGRRFLRTHMKQLYYHLKKRRQS